MNKLGLVLRWSAIFLFNCSAIITEVLPEKVSELSKKIIDEENVRMREPFGH